MPTWVLTLVRSRVLWALSVEFKAIEERNEGGIRVITKPNLLAIGIVDRPAYPDAVGQNTRQPLSSRDFARWMG